MEGPTYASVRRREHVIGGSILIETARFSSPTSMMPVFEGVLLQDEKLTRGPVKFPHVELILHPLSFACRLPPPGVGGEPKQMWLVFNQQQN